MDRLINIDNGGTLTDIVVGSGNDFRFTKTLTTPVDLSQCVFDSMTKVSKEIYGEVKLPELLHSTRHIRYSSTQGTNALVERKGPKVGIITDDEDLLVDLRATDEMAKLFRDVIGDRVSVISQVAEPQELARGLVTEVNRLTTAGSERLVIAATTREREQFYKHVMLTSFPRHLLGSVPVLFSMEFAQDTSRMRQIWSGILNSFLHPTVERFLYATEHRLREHKVKNPLLIYRNDGASSRVAKSVALKTYSSGPRGGLEGTRALAEAFALDKVLMIDVGGTTTDVGVVNRYQIVTDRRGVVEGVDISFEMSDVRSRGVGGSSIIAVQDGVITIGPESVGAAPGPACFGFGGQQATITDVNLLLGILDPETYLDGQMSLDAERARAVIVKAIAEPLGTSLEEALIRMESAYAEHLAATFADLVDEPESTTVAAFGGGGPMSACSAARIAGVRHVLVPMLASVFSAYGISFSNISQSYEKDITGATQEAIAEARKAMEKNAARDMFHEGYAMEDCDLEWSLLSEEPERPSMTISPYTGWGPLELSKGQSLTLTLKATFHLPHPQIDGRTDAPPSEAVSATHREVRTSTTETESVPVYQLVDQEPGATATGPAVIEGPFFTSWVPRGWDFEISAGQDLLLTDVS